MIAKGKYASLIKNRGCLLLLLVLLQYSVFTSEIYSSESTKEIETDTYFLLGMLQEYGARSITEDSDLVEGFYWGEQLQAYIMVVYLNKIMNEIYSFSDVETRRKQNLLVHVHSESMTKYINSYYDYEYQYGAKAHVDGEWKKTGAGNFPYSAFEKGDRSLKLAYLAGAYYRFGADNSIRLTNGFKKGDLLARLLKETGCSVSEIDTVIAVPSSVTISFQPTAEMEAWFDKYPGQWAFKEADTLFGLATDEELQIYRTIISLFQNGASTDCVLATPCIVPRTSGMRGDGKTHIPDLSPDYQEALDDFNERRTEFVSLIGLTSDSVTVVNEYNWKSGGSAAFFGRIGFSSDRLYAIAIGNFVCDNSETAIPSFAFFLDNVNGIWKLTHYRIRGR